MRSAPASQMGLAMLFAGCDPASNSSAPGPGDGSFRVAWKTPAATDTLADHGIVAPDPPVSMPAGSILVKIRK